MNIVPKAFLFIRFMPLCLKVSSTFMELFLVALLCFAKFTAIDGTKTCSSTDADALKTCYLRYFDALKFNGIPTYQEWYARTENGAELLDEAQLCNVTKQLSTCQRPHAHCLRAPEDENLAAILSIDGSTAHVFNAFHDGLEILCANKDNGENPQTNPCLWAVVRTDVDDCVQRHKFQNTSACSVVTDFGQCILQRMTQRSCKPDKIDMVCKFKVMEALMDNGRKECHEANTACDKKTDA